MLVENDSIKTELLRKLELVEVSIIEQMTLLRIIGAVGNHHPC
jgi:hypothetical protein